jgi:hypothetical protein
MKTNFTAKAELLIGAPQTIFVWYDRNFCLEGGKFRGEWEGKAYVDKGTIVEIVPEKRFVSTLGETT